jgi:hypothetical protein
MRNDLVDASGNSDRGEGFERSDRQPCGTDLKSGQDMISFLPFEVLLQILKPFNSKELLRTIRLVSIRWKQIANFLIRHKLLHHSRLVIQIAKTSARTFTDPYPPEEYICHPIDSSLEKDDLCIWEPITTNSLEKPDLTKVSPQEQIWFHFPQKITLIPSPSWTITLPNEIIGRFDLTKTQRQSFLSESGQCYWLQDKLLKSTSFTQNVNILEERILARSQWLLEIEWTCLFKHGEQNAKGGRRATLLSVSIPIWQLVRVEDLYKKSFERQDLQIRVYDEFDPLIWGFSPAWD